MRGEVTVTRLGEYESMLRLSSGSSGRRRNERQRKEGGGELARADLCLFSLLRLVAQRKLSISSDSHQTGSNSTRPTREFGSIQNSSVPRLSSVPLPSRSSSPSYFPQALRHELAQAVYLNVPVVILPPPRNRALVADYARAVNACLAAGGPFGQISIRIPISDPAELVQPIGGSRSSSSIPSRASGATSTRLSTAQPGISDPSATWEIWDCIRTICGYNPRLSLSE